MRRFSILLVIGCLALGGLSGLAFGWLARSGMQTARPVEAQLAQPIAASASRAAPLCGEGSPPDYGFTYDLRQPHWTVGGDEYVSRATLDQVDVILDRLDADVIAQTMILILPPQAVGDRVNCAVHFLRYMGLGQPSGPRQDNGFVFLVVVEPDKIDVHYGVGLGLPALTAQELTPLNRLAEDTYQSTHSLDDALLALIRAYDETARQNYAPLNQAQATAAPQSSREPSVTVEPLNWPTDPLGLTVMCCMICIAGFVLFFILWVLIKLMQAGVSIGPFIGGGWGGDNWGSRGGFGGGGWSGGGGFGGFGGRGGLGGGGRSRGGSGGGRSGRGN